MEKSYDIAGTTYTQRPLVLGQIARLAAELEGLQFRSASPVDILAGLGPRLPRALAAVLVPEGVSLRDVQIEPLAADLEAGLSLDQTLEVIEDFFALTLTPSLIEKVAGAVGRIAARLNPESGSPSSASPSPTET